MKYFTMVLGLILFVSCAHVSTNSPPVNFTGKWKGAINAVNMQLDFDFNFKCDGKLLTGTAREKKQRPNKSLKIEHGKIDGKKIFFIINTGEKYAGRDVKYKFTGEYIRENMIKLKLFMVPETPQSSFASFNIERVY